MDLVCLIIKEDKQADHSVCN